MRVTFFRVAERKSPKKGRPPVCDPFAVRRGKPASGRLRGAPQNSLRACGAPFEQLRRVSSRSMGAATPMPPRNRPAAGAASRGGTAEQPNSPHGPSLRSASRSRRAAPAPSRPSAAMARVVVRLRVPSCACREAQGRGCVRVPQDTRTSCTDSPQLFERSAPARSEFCGAPPDRASQVARSAAKGHAQQGRFLFGDFLLEGVEEIYFNRPNSMRA